MSDILLYDILSYSFSSLFIFTVVFNVTIHLTSKSNKFHDCNTNSLIFKFSNYFLFAAQKCRLSFKYSLLSNNSLSTQKSAYASPVSISLQLLSLSVNSSLALVPKSYRPKGQPRSTRNEFPIRADFGNSRKHPIWRLKRGGKLTAKGAVLSPEKRDFTVLLTKLAFIVTLSLSRTLPT